MRQWESRTLPGFKKPADRKVSGLFYFVELAGRPRQSSVLAEPPRLTILFLACGKRRGRSTRAVEDQRGRPAAAKGGSPADLTGPQAFDSQGSVKGEHGARSFGSCA